MGMDDANEGPDSGECWEHKWVLEGASVSSKGSQMNYVCRRCGAVMVDASGGAEDVATSGD
ncbi:3-oxoacyl-ACP reductase [Georgenia thermotolerans]|uniref:3-oxoacyl-ACP reductase n=2 Tax=Georgenia thermotolerans TaxID=527326 RepID=A0A7J5UR40_9MICO|nr:3-oxoacyl-ACP reductase [Georgenia thermotolerans]